MTTAPDFTPGYPSGGELISQAWQVAWDELAAEIVPRPELQALMVEKTGCAPKTAINLITKALTTRRVVVTERYRGVAMLCRADVLEASCPDHPALKKEG